MPQPRAPGLGLSIRHHPGEHQAAFAAPSTTRRSTTHPVSCLPNEWCSAAGSLRYGDSRTEGPQENWAAANRHRTGPVPTEGRLRLPASSRVAPGAHAPRAPTDPDVRISRIRLVRSRLRYAGQTPCAMRGRGSGYASNITPIDSRPRVARERRANHLHHSTRVQCRNASSAAKFPMMP